MRVKQIVNVDGFYKALAKCQGKSGIDHGRSGCVELSIYIDTVYRADNGIQQSKYRGI